MKNLFSWPSLYSLTAFTYYALGLFSGSLADRISTRAVACAGIVLPAPGCNFAPESYWMLIDTPRGTDEMRD